MGSAAGRTAAGGGVSKPGTTAASSPRPAAFADAAEELSGAHVVEDGASDGDEDDDDAESVANEDDDELPGFRHGPAAVGYTNPMFSDLPPEFAGLAAFGGDLGAPGIGGGFGFEQALFGGHEAHELRAGGRRDSLRALDPGAADALADHSEEFADAPERFEEVVQEPEDPMPPPPQRRGLGLALDRVKAAAGIGRQGQPKFIATVPMAQPARAIAELPLEEERTLLAPPVAGVPLPEPGAGILLPLETGGQSPHGHREPEAPDRNPRRRGRGSVGERAIVAPYAGGDAEAAAFAPVVLIRPASADPTTLQPTHRGGRGGDAAFLPVTVVRPRGQGEGALLSMYR